MSWVNWFEFSSDPFILSPLQSEDEFESIYIKTDAVENQLSYISTQVIKEPFTSIIVGERGIGKSTTLQYALYLCRKEGILTIYVGLLPYGIKESIEPVYALTQEVISSIIKELIIGIYLNDEKMFKIYKDRLIQWGNYVGLTYDEFDGFYRSPGYRLEFSVLKDVLFGLLNICERNGKKILLAIDNLDKIEPKIMIPFLMGGTAQSLIESLNNNGVSVLISTDTNTHKIIERESDLSYLRKVLLLNPLSPTESENIINSRVEKYSIKTASSYYEKKAIHYISNSTKGITRDIINDTRGLFELAFEKKIKFISYDFVRMGLEGFNPKEKYYEIIVDHHARNGAEKLLSLAYETEITDLSTIIKLIYSLYEEKRVKIKSDIIRLLLSNNIIIYNEYKSKYEIDKEISHLIYLVQQSGWIVEEFLQWLLKAQTIEEVRIQTPGSKIKKYIDSLMILYRNIDYESCNTLNLYSPYDSKKLNIGDMQDLIIKNSAQLYKNYSEFSNIIIEDINTDFFLHSAYIILKTYLLLFSHYYILLKNQEIEVRKNSISLNNWSYIRDVIHLFQRNEYYKFLTYTDINEILEQYNKMKKSGYNLSFNEAEKIVYILEEIIIEFYEQLNNYIILNDLLKKDEFILIDPNNYQTIIDKIDEISIKYGYIEAVEAIELYTYDQFIDINKEYQKFNNIILFKKYFNKNENRYNYFICLLYKYNTPMIQNDILEYFSIINITTSKLDALQDDSIKKSNYLFWICSIHGFTKETQKLFSKTKRPLRTSIYLMDIDKINLRLYSNQIEQISKKQIMLKEKEEIITVKDDVSSHVFILYRFGNIKSEICAKKLKDYLDKYNINTVLFENKIKWGESITDFEEDMIDNAFASVICFTEDFKEGRTAQEEYRAVLAKRRYDDSFKVGLLLIDSNISEVPPFMKDYIYASVTGPDDSNIEQEMEKIYKGLIGLSLE